MVVDENAKKIVEIEARLEAINSTEMEYYSNAKHFSNLFQISSTRSESDDFSVMDERLNDTVAILQLPFENYPTCINSLWNGLVN